jgi:hypothetical protein
MQIYAITSDSHNLLKSNWFLPSIRDEFPVEFEEVVQIGNGIIGTTEFNRVMLKKVDLILRAIEEQWGNWFIYSDVDVQFLRPFRRIAEIAIADVDIAFQRDSPTGELCAGFFVARANERVKTLWADVREKLQQNLEEHDQTWLNRILDPLIWIQHPNCSVGLRTGFLLLRALRLTLRTRAFCKAERWAKLRIQCLCGCRIGLLPDQVFGAGTFTGTAWNSANPFPIPHRACIHHANYASGVSAKITQLQYVHSKTRESNRLSATITISTDTVRDTRNVDNNPKSFRAACGST